MEMVSTKVFAVSLIVAIIASSAITSAFFVSQAPQAAPGKQLVNVTDYIGGLIDQDVVPYAAIMERYYEQNGIAISIVLLSGTSAAVQALAADRSGFAFFVQGSIFNIVALEGNTLNASRLVAVASNGNTNPIGVLSLKSSGISKPSDLIGKTVGTPLGSLSAQMFDAFLNRTGLQGKINVQYIAFPQLAPALFAKKIDAIVQYVANVAGLTVQAEKIGEQMSFFRLADYGMPPVGFGILVQKNLIDNHPDVVKAIVNATMTGIRFCILDTPRCVADLIRAYPNFNYDIALADTLAHWNYTWGPPFDDTLKVQSLTPLQLGWQDPGTVAQVVQLAEQIYHVSGIDPNTVFTNQFVEAP
jgi:NitT/TauT family transport system substrate-binding protein